MAQSYFQQLVFTALLLIISVVACEQVVLDSDEDCYPDVSIEGLGPSHYDLNETVAYALNLCQAREFLNNTRHRLLLSQFQSNVQYQTKSEYDVFEAMVYDYTKARTMLVNGVPFEPTLISFTEANIQPLPNAEELGEAAQIAEIQSHEFVHSGMPPVITRDFPNGTSQRIVNIALNSANSSRSFYVNMNDRTVESPLDQGGSESTLACEAPPPAFTSANTRGIPGTANIIITQGGKVLWTFEAIRPSASSGTKGSGIELRNVKYKGKSVLYQAHVPILNIQYEQANTGCGPYYRDWQYSEFPLHCNGVDGPPGFRLCSSPAKTILDPPETDGGNFAGVAVYIDGPEVVLKSQMEAGWYRYVSEWRFHVDGTLKPRFGFAAVYQVPYCVCQVHHHHVYWRLDFDIVTAGNNLVREYNNPPLFPPSNYHDKIYEIRRPKDPSRHRHWEISTTRYNHETYALIPGSNDGTMDAYGIGDLWVLRWHPNELDDGVALTGGSAAQTMEHIDNFINGELVRDTDVVLWYAAHFKHDQSLAGGGNHVVGPDIIPLKWWGD